MSYRDEYYDDRPRRNRPEPRRNVAGTIGWSVVGIVCLIVILAIGWLAWGDITLRYTTSNLQPTPAPMATQRPYPTPLPVVVPQPVIVQQVPQGAAPQQVIIPAPIAPAVSDPAIEQPASNAPIVIVQHDGYQQPVITGSGACKVAALGARRCGN
jgi:hypothetical protein